MINIDCLAPDLVLLFEDDLVLCEWVDEIGCLLLIFSPLFVLIQVPWIISIGLLLPCLLPYIHVIIIILLPQLPLALPILYNDLVQFLPELILCNSRLLHPAVLIYLLHSNPGPGVTVEHLLDQVFETLVQLFALLRLIFAEVSFPEEIVLPRS